MCLAVPAQIISLDGKKALVDFNGIRRSVDVSLIENPALGDYVLVHAGYAIQKVEEEIARETCRLLHEYYDREF